MIEELVGSSGSGAGGAGAGIIVKVEGGRCCCRRMLRFTLLGFKRSKIGGYGLWVMGEGERVME